MAERHRVETIIHQSLPGDQRDRIERAIADCMAEHGGRPVGRPGYYMRDGFTVLTYDESEEWWRALAGRLLELIKAEFIERRRILKRLRENRNGGEHT